MGRHNKMELFECTAFPIHQHGTAFYIAAVRADDLLTICRPLSRPGEAGLFGRDAYDREPLSKIQLSSLVSALETKEFQAQSLGVLSEEKREPYQRFLDEKRAVEICRYIEQPNSLLPNSIILAVNVDFDEADVIQADGDKSLRICLPRNTSSAVILDGQHRVAALRYMETDIRNEYQLLVAFLVGIPFYQQAELFAVINGKQKPVNRSIIYDLFGYAPLVGDKDQQLYEGFMAVARFCSRVTRILNRVPESPWQHKIKMRGPGDEGIISQAAVVEYLSALIEPKKLTRRVKVLPLLYNFFKDSDPAGCAALLILYLRAIQTALRDYWQNPKSLLWKNNGVAVIFRVLHDELLLADTADNLMDLSHSIVERWRRAPSEDLAEPPKTGGGGVQNQLYERFKSTMFNKSELLLLLTKVDQQKEELLKIGGLVR